MGIKGAGSFTHREGPGPGEYSSTTVFERIKGAATFGRFNRIGGLKTSKQGKEGEALSKSMVQVPGPGSYNGNYKTITRNPP